MKRLFTVGVLCATFLLFMSCGNNVNYSKALFSHVPVDPELLVVIKPNDMLELTKKAIDEIELDKFIDPQWQVDTASMQTYLRMTVDILKELGIPVEKVNSVAVLIYFQKPTIMLSGDFLAENVKTKLKELGFKEYKDGYFDYVYHEYKMLVPEDGLMMLSEPEVLQDLMAFTAEQSLWNREDFKDYRLKSPLDNSIFLWSQPPENFLSEFQYRDSLDNVSLAINVHNTLSMKATVRIHDPQHAVYLHDILFGGVTLAGGLFGEDDVYGPVFKSIKVIRDQSTVTASVVVPAEKIIAVKDQLIKDLGDPDSNTFTNFQKFFNQFQ